MSTERLLIINADDYGIGPATSEGILRLGQAGQVSSSVVLVNSPYAEADVERWRKAGRPMELGWHPALTLDRPLLPTGEVHTLVDGEGKFYPLKTFLRRLMLGKVKAGHIRAELLAQYRRCCELLGGPPALVNTHHHVQIFPPVGEILRGILKDQQPVPYLRIVREPWPQLVMLPGARVKRLVLNVFGRSQSRRQRRAGFLGNDWLVGVIGTGQEKDTNLFADLVRHVPGNVIELTCHPGKRDETLVGRDCTSEDGMLDRRPREMEMLAAASFAVAWKEAGFVLVTPEKLRAIYQARDACGV